MSVSFGNVSPFISHLTCIILGVIINNASHQSPPVYRKKNFNSIYLPIQKSKFFNFSDKLFLVGDPIFLLKKDSLNPKIFCLYSWRDDLNIHSLDGVPTLSLKKTKHQRYLKAFLGKEKDLYLILSREQAFDYKPCQKEPKVSYGSKY
ncbi:MAG: hypothetical protein CMP11_06585 [Zetaproteobacteria bacterium]|nr:hypothetical protein [Pseudobdellovibrionaceae bacterium]